MSVNRPTQAERSAATRTALLDAATPLFAEQGFAAVGTEAIVRTAGVTRGALYHQFADKTELFAAVFEAVESALTARIGELVAATAPGTPLEALRAGADAWLEACSNPVVHRIVLVEGPAVLGWSRWREIGMRYGVGLVELMLRAAIDAGQLRTQPVLPLAHILIGALDEAALYCAQADDPNAARAEMHTILDDVITALAVDDGQR